LASRDLLVCDAGPVNPLDSPDTGGAEDPVELTYLAQPVEILPFGWEGW
jgi:hypothetical protein